MTPNRHDDYRWTTSVGLHLGSLSQMGGDLITLNDAAAILHVSWQRVQQLVAEGKLRAVTDLSVQRRILFRRTDVERRRVEVEWDR